MPPGRLLFWCRICRHRSPVTKPVLRRASVGLGLGARDCRFFPAYFQGGMLSFSVLGETRLQEFRLFLINIRCLKPLPDRANSAPMPQVTLLEPQLIDRFCWLASTRGKYN